MKKRTVVRDFMVIDLEEPLGGYFVPPGGAFLLTDVQFAARPALDPCQRITSGRKEAKA
jgi:hypothetical protein